MRQQKADVDKKLTESERAIVEAHIPLAGRIAKNSKFVKQHADWEDAKQIACLAMCKAVKRFDSSKGKWSSYASLSIKSDIHGYFHENRLIRVPRWVFSNWRPNSKSREDAVRIQKMQIQELPSNI